MRERNNNTSPTEGLNNPNQPKTETVPEPAPAAISAAERVLAEGATDTSQPWNETATSSEYGHRLQPKIYAACLAAYNNGYLHGDWIYADQQPDDLMAEVWQMLEKSPIQPAEEWAIHDYEDFAGFELHEYERLDTVARIAGGLALHGAAFAHWAHETGSDAEDAIETFDDHYRGSYDSFEDLATETLDGLGIELHERNSQYLWMRFLRVVTRRPVPRGWW